MTIGERETQKAAKRAAHKQAAADREAAARRRAALTGVITAVVAIGAVVGLLALLGAFSGSSGTTTASSLPSSAATSAAPQPQVSLDPQLANKPAVTKGDAADLTKLDVKTLVAGTGPAVQALQSITVNYVGVFYKTGEEFDSSWKGGQPATFVIGDGKVIKGWDQALVGVKVGSRVQLDIPGSLAYGNTEAEANGRPAGPLRFVVDIIAAQ